MFRTARSLHGGLAGDVIRRSQFRVPHLAAADLSGQAVVEVRSRGKHLLHRFSGGLTLHTHLGMEGQWRLHRPGEAWTGGPAHEVRAVLETDRFVALGYRLQVVDLVPTSEEERVVGHLGPDLLGPDWDLQEALRRLRRRPEREVGEALLDQRNLAGIGNLYKAEALFLKGVNPWTPVGGVPGLEGVLLLAKRLLEFSVRVGIQSTTGARKTSEKNWVFERPGQPCRRCRTLVQVRRQGEDPARERLTYWCPGCQPPFPRAAPGGQ